MSKRVVVRKLLSVIGLTELRWRSLSYGLYCFNYHRIGDRAGCMFDRGVFSCSAARFREHVELLQERFEVINLAKLQAILGRRPPRRPLALITFDDGYADNYETAYPILKEFGITAVFFIPTAFIGGSRLPWWDEIAWSLRNATVERIVLERAEGDFDLRAAEVERTIGRVLALVKARHEVPMDEQVVEIREASQPAGSVKDAGLGLFVNREGLREMRRAGMDIGSHTHSHPLLSHLDAQSQRDELEKSKAILEEILGEPVTSVAYPVGSLSAYTQETCKIAESLGYCFGFNFVHKANRLPIEKAFEVTRFAMGNDQSVSDLKASVSFEWL